MMKKRGKFVCVLSICSESMKRSRLVGEQSSFDAHSPVNHYLTELKILKSDFFKSYDVSNVTPLGKSVVEEFYIRFCPHK